MACTKIENESRQKPLKFEINILFLHITTQVSQETFLGGGGGVETK